MQKNSTHTEESDRQPRDSYELSEWQTQRSEHIRRISDLTEDYFQRRQQQEKDPVMDFLFEYYAFRPSHLRRWSPGLGVILKGRDFGQLNLKELQIDQNCAFLDPRQLPVDRLDSMKWVRSVLANSQKKRPSFGCMGMHEWAMVYKTKNIRHSHIPLRISMGELQSIVESRPLVCTHFDAFRFFSEEARPLNRYKLDRKKFHVTEQPGCIHTNMDLYKWAFKFYPWISSNLIRKAFELALEARIIDMRASPYDLQNQGLEPIRIETEEGQMRYVRQQRKIFQKSVPIRSELIQSYRYLISSTEEYSQHGYLKLPVEFA